MSRKDKRFIKSDKEIGFISGCEVLVDTETGVQYLFYQSGYAGGLTVLLDKDGKPLIDKEITNNEEVKL